MRRVACLLAALAVASAWTPSLVRSADEAEPPAPVKIETSVEPAEVTIGTPFRYTVEVVPEQGVELFVPVLSDQHGDFIITDFGQERARTGAGVRYWYTLIGYEAGAQFVPGPSIGYRSAASEVRQVEAPKTLVKLTSLLARSKPPHQLRDIKGPVDLPADYPWMWVAGALLGIVALVAWGLVRLLGRKRTSRTIAERPAHEVALEALARLRSARLFEAGQVEQYYVRLSAIVRGYLEARFLLRAPEMTTEEFLGVAQRSPQLVSGHRPVLGQFLGEADLVKFAQHVPREIDAERAYTAAREFVESTTPAPPVKS